MYHFARGNRFKSNMKASHEIFRPRSHPEPLLSNRRLVLGAWIVCKDFKTTALGKLDSKQILLEEGIPSSRGNGIGFPFLLLARDI